MNAAWAISSSVDLRISVSWFLAMYSLGSIPEAWLLTKWVRGQDLREVGSGNVGVMNTAVNVARWAGLLVFLLEIGKGVLAVLATRYFGLGEEFISTSVIAVVIGTRWPIWLGFKGGRGNTAGISALALISYPATVIIVAVWILARLLLNNSFKATRVTMLSLSIILAIVTRSGWYTFTALMLSLIYLGAQDTQSDDHTLIKERWVSFWGFLKSPVRRH